MTAHETATLTGRLLPIGLLLAAVTLLGLALTGHRVGRRSRLRLEALAGCAAVVAVVTSPLDGWSDASVAHHMVQHLILVVVAAPLLALGEPAALLGSIGPTGWRRSHLRAHRWLRRSVTSVPGALAATVPFVIVMSVWHVPAWYDAAVQHELLHGVEHVMLLLTAALAWSVLPLDVLNRTTPPPRRAPAPFPGPALAALGLMMLHGAALGLLLLVLPHRIYQRPPNAEGVWHAVGDQQAAGAVLWAVGGTTAALVMVVLFGWWLATQDRPTSTGTPTRQGPEQLRENDHQPV